MWSVFVVFVIVVLCLAVIGDLVGRLQMWLDERMQRKIDIERRLRQATERRNA